jgi:hypothetical protein
MPRGVYDHSHRRKNQPKSKTSTGSHVNELPVDTTNLVLQNGDREMMKGLLEKELEVATKKVTKIKGLLEQIPV